MYFYADEVSEGKYIVVCCLSDDGNVTYVRGTHDATAKQVDTNLFSNYAVFVSGDPAVVVDGGSGAGPYAEGTTVTIRLTARAAIPLQGGRSCLTALRYPTPRPLKPPLPCPRPMWS